MSVVGLFEGIIGGFIPDFDKWVGGGSSRGGSSRGGSSRGGSSRGGSSRGGSSRSGILDKTKDNNRRALMDYKEATRYSGTDRYKF